MPTEQAVLQTPSSAPEVYAALAAAWPSAIGGTPTKTALVVMTTQSALETGAWQHMYNWNVGNLAGTQHDYVMLHAYTGAYRPYWAFTSLEDGAAAFLHLIASRYSAALAPAAAGDLAGYAAALKARGYYEEDESKYEAALRSRYAQVAAAIGGAPVPIPSGSPASRPSGLAIATLSAGVLAGYWLYLESRAPVRHAARRARRRYAMI